MMTEVLNMLISMFQGILGIVDRVFSGLDGWDLVLGALIVTTVHRMLLVPLVGGSTANGIRDLVASEKAKGDGSRVNVNKVNGNKKKGGSENG